MFVQININNRENPILHGVIQGAMLLQRVARISIPFFAFYGPTALASSVLLSSLKCYQIVQEMDSAYENGEWKKLSYHSLEMGMTLASLAASIYAPRLGILMTHGGKVALEVARLTHGIWKLDLSKIATSSLCATYQIVYLASTSTLLGTTELLALSLLSKAVTELYESRQEFKEGRYLEGLANLTLAALRIGQANPHLRTSHRNWLGKKLDQKELDRFLLEMTSSSQTDFEKLLKENGYSSHLSDLDFFQTYNCQAPIQNTYFRNIFFNRCQFANTFTSSKFEKCLFARCLFTNSKFFSTNFINSFIFQSRIDDSLFDSSLLDGMFFVGSNLRKTNFKDSIMDLSLFLNSKLFETSFLGTNDGPILCRNEITDCALKNKEYQIGNKVNPTTKPVVAMSWHFHSPLAYASLEATAIKEHYNPVLMPFEFNPEKIDTKQLEGEVRHHLQKLDGQVPDDALSLPDAILKRSQPTSEIGKIKAMAEAIIGNADALLLPGGSDIPPEFYGQKSRLVLAENDYRRSMLEFALLQKAYEKGTPLMGICRGAQMTNVFMGGTLHQHVDGQRNLQQLEVVDAEIAGKIGVGHMVGSSMHHQACDKIGKDLTVFLKHEDIPKGLIHKKLPWILLQFHPESYYNIQNEEENIFGMKEDNKKMFDYFFSNVNESFAKKKREQNPI